MTSKVLALATVVAAQLVVLLGVAHAGVPPTPVPEPATLTLLGVGAAALAARAWWKRRK